MDAPIAQPENEHERECFSSPEKKPKLATNSDSDSDSDSVDDDDSSDSEDGLHSDGLRKMTKAEERRYMKQVRESEGFDVEDFRHIFAFGLITPSSLDLEDERFKTYIDLAIDHYYKKENKKLELVRFLKANVTGSYYIYYYITFEAKDAADGQIQEYQAKVVDDLSEICVEFCRLKPTKKGQ